MHTAHMKQRGNHGLTAGQNAALRVCKPGEISQALRLICFIMKLLKKRIKGEKENAGYYENG